MLRGFSSVDSEQAGCVQGGMCPWREERGTGEVLTVQYHRQRAGNGNESCTGFSIVNSEWEPGWGMYGVQRRGQQIGTGVGFVRGSAACTVSGRRAAEGVQHRG